MRMGMEPWSSGCVQSTTAPASSSIIPCTTCRMFCMLALVRGRSPTVTVSHAYHRSDKDPTRGVASRNQVVLCQCSNSGSNSEVSAIAAETDAINSPTTSTLSFHRHWPGCHNLRRPIGWVNLTYRHCKNLPNFGTSGDSRVLGTGRMVAQRRVPNPYKRTASEQQKTPAGTGLFQCQSSARGPDRSPVAGIVGVSA